MARDQGAGRGAGALITVGVLRGSTFRTNTLPTLKIVPKPVSNGVPMSIPVTGLNAKGADSAALKTPCEEAMSFVSDMTAECAGSSSELTSGFETLWKGKSPAVSW